MAAQHFYSTTTSWWRLASFAGKRNALLMLQDAHE
jgi:hypothetical protein